MLGGAEEDIDSELDFRTAGEDSSNGTVKFPLPGLLDDSSSEEPVEKEGVLLTACKSL